MISLLTSFKTFFSQLFNDKSLNSLWDTELFQWWIKPMYTASNLGNWIKTEMFPNCYILGHSTSEFLSFFANYSSWDLLFLFPQYCVQSKKNIWVENMFWLYLAAPVSRNPRNPILGLFLFLLPALFPCLPSARSLAIMNSLYLPNFSS